MKLSILVTLQGALAARNWSQFWQHTGFWGCSLLILLGSPVVFAQQQRPVQAVQFPTAPSAQARFTIQPIPSEANTWGFIIERDGKPFIRQVSIPTLPGNRGFASPDKARKAAGLMVDKIRKGQMPPSLSKEELQKANLL